MNRRRLPTTPRSQVRSALRQLWLRSRERQAALKRDKYTCTNPFCGKKQSRKKGHEVYVEVNHIDGVNWTFILDYIYRHLLVPPEQLETLCKECHKKYTKDFGHGK